MLTQFTADRELWGEPGVVWRGVAQGPLYTCNTTTHLSQSEGNRIYLSVHKLRDS